MTEILQGLLIGLMVIHAYRLNSWVVNIILILIVSSVLTAELTSIHEVLPFVSVLLLLTVNLILSEKDFKFNGLLALNLCLLIHVLSAYISAQSSFLLISLFALIYLLLKIVKNQQWHNALLLLTLALMSMLLNDVFWLSISCFIVVLIWYKQQHQLIIGTSSLNSHESLLAEIETAKTKERSRIYQNIHDDVGAELLQMIYELDNEVQITRIKNVMNKLRQAVASTAHINTKADQLLQEITEECQSRCDVAGIKFNQETTFHANPRLSQTQPIHLQRILRELINNCLKHASAKTINLSAEVFEQTIEVILTDDGIGINSTNIGGKGMQSLKKRVASEGGEINWSSDKKGGTQVKLTVVL